MIEDKYKGYDLSASQEYVLELLSKLQKPDGKQITTLLLNNRYSWFSVTPIHNNSFVPHIELLDGSYYADGVSIYTDISGQEKLVPLLQEISDTEINYVCMRPESECEDMEKAFPKETTTFVTITWDCPPELQLKFANSIK